MSEFMTVSTCTAGQSLLQINFFDASIATASINELKPIVVTVSPLGSSREAWGATTSNGDDSSQENTPFEEYWATVVNTTTEGNGNNATSLNGEGNGGDGSDGGGSSDGIVFEELTGNITTCVPEGTSCLAITTDNISPDNFEIVWDGDTVEVGQLTEDDSSSKTLTEVGSGNTCLPECSDEDELLFESRIVSREGHGFSWRIEDDTGNALYSSPNGGDSAQSAFARAVEAVGVGGVGEGSGGGDGGRVFVDRYCLPRDKCHAWVMTSDEGGNDAGGGTSTSSSLFDVDVTIDGQPASIDEHLYRLRSVPLGNKCGCDEDESLFEFVLVEDDGRSKKKPDRGQHRHLRHLRRSLQEDTGTAPTSSSFSWELQSVFDQDIIETQTFGGEEDDDDGTTFRYVRRCIPNNECLNFVMKGPDLTASVDAADTDADPSKYNGREYRYGLKLDGTIYRENIFRYTTTTTTPGGEEESTTLGSAGTCTAESLCANMGQQESLMELTIQAIDISHDVADDAFDWFVRNGTSSDFALMGYTFIDVYKSNTEYRVLSCVPDEPCLFLAMPKGAPGTYTVSINGGVVVEPTFMEQLVLDAFLGTMSFGAGGGSDQQYDIKMLGNVGECAVEIGDEAGGAAGGSMIPISALTEAAANMMYYYVIIPAFYVALLIPLIITCCIIKSRNKGQAEDGTPQDKEWAQGCGKCCDEMGNCCFTFWCPCFAMCKASRQIGENTAGIFYCIAPFCYLSCCALMCLADRVARKRSIKLGLCENALKSWCDIFCCFSCTVTREASIYQNVQNNPPPPQQMERLNEEESFDAGGSYVSDKS